MPGALAEIMRAAPLSAGKVDFAWRAAVGPVILARLQTLLGKDTVATITVREP